MLSRQLVDTNDPAIRSMIIRQYRRYGEEFVKEEYGVTRQRIQRWKSLQDRTGALAPQFEERGREAALSPRSVRKLERALLDDPYLTNAELSAKVGNRITPHSAGNYIVRSDYDFVWKLEQEDVEAAFTARHVEEGLKFRNKVRRIPHERRVYVDETPISAGVRRRKGRFPSGTPAWTPKNRIYPRKVVIGAVKHDGWLHPARIYNKGSLTTAEFEHYVEHDLAPHLEEGDVVIWDQWGKSGRARNPTAHHFSPNARAIIEARGASVLFLPPAGKHFNPIEPLFGEGKQYYDRTLGRLCRNVQPSKVSFAELAALWHEAESSIGHASFVRAFKERADGKEFLRVCTEKGLLENDE